MHPRFKQVPPSWFFSMIATLEPSCAALIAAVYPPGPAPITIKSKEFVMMINISISALYSKAEDL